MIDIWTKLALAGAAVSFAAYLVMRHARRIACISDRIVRIPRSRLAAFLLFAAVATVCAQKGGNTNTPPEGASSPRAAPPVRTDEGGGDVTNLCFAGISVSSNAIALSLAWPTNFFEDGACLDFFAKVGSLTNSWVWIASAEVLPGETNLVAEIPSDILSPATNLPSAAFFLATDRATSAATMADFDCDGIPDVYELHNGTNPYVPDAALAPRLTVGSGGEYATVEDALAASTDYSIVALAAGEHELPSSWPLVMPSHPVMLTGPDGGYAVLRSRANVAAVLLDQGQGAETFFRNLVTVLEHEGGFQAGFWIGGNLPWSGLAASPAFENVRVRALYPETLYYGWHYYRDDDGASVISNCMMNAAGATNVIGVYSYGGPDVAVADCHFVNFPTNGGNYATYFQDGTNIVAEAEAYVKSYRDINRNGVYDAEADILLSQTLPYRHAASTVRMVFGDVDHDGVSDVLELEDGTNPYDAKSYCFNLSIAVQGVIRTTNDLSVAVMFGDAAVYGPVFATNRTFTADIGHLVATNGEPVTVYFWDDANSNGVRDVGEAYTSCGISVRGHENVVTNTFPTAAFDHDADGVMDWWEALHADAGLSSTNSADAYLDPDGDGLINLHEYWANCNPLVYDGTNTAIYAAVHSIDDRLTTTNSIGRLKYYMSIGSHSATMNTNCWAQGIDISCMSASPAEYPATLVTRKHFICATHHKPGVGSVRYFSGLDGVVYNATVSKLYQVGSTDLTVGEFSQPLPDSIVPAMILPIDYATYIGSGRGIPALHSDNEKKAVVADLVSLGESYIRARIPIDEVRRAYYEHIIVGDSGHPRFLVLGNNVVLLDCVHSGPGSPGTGPSVHHYREAIQQAIESFGDTNSWEMTEVDFSDFVVLPNY